ncbi:MAG: efflux RND transporter periplasmic adaptor subunit [Steroidobacteraceae bacterium]
MIVRSQPFTKQLRAYAQVEPIAVLPVRAMQSGVVMRLRMVPGSAVKAGETLAELGGPEIQSVMAQDEANVRAARARLSAATRALTSERELLTEQLATRQTLAAAESALAAARAAFQTAASVLRAAQRLRTLRAPGDGLVLAVNAAEGERVAAGQSVLTLQLTHRLWLRAAYYGANAMAIHAGMRGQFVPTEGKAVAVEVATVFGTLQPDGGESVGLTPTEPIRWLAGETGIVTLDGRARSLPAVPTRSLILDQGRWWVLVRTPRGDIRRLVTPGPTRGWQTFIEHGLEPDERVVVVGAYLEFHREIARQYQPPDD